MPVDYDHLNSVLDLIQNRTSGELQLEVMLWRKFTTPACETFLPRYYSVAQAFFHQVAKRLDQLEPDVVISSLYKKN